MSEFITALGPLDLAAIIVFVILWLSFELVTDYTPLRSRSLSGHMSAQRTQWMKVMAGRDMRMIDTQILAGLQQGSAFFASTSIFAIGGCFALLGSTDMVLQIYQDLPITREFSRAVWEVKVIGLVMLFAYTFFKFGWAYRVFNYCSIMIGAVPLTTEASLEQRESAAMAAAKMNIIAARHFTSGLRGIFFAAAYIGWFVGPKTLIVASVFVLLILIRRQYFSHARRILISQDI